MTQVPEKKHAVLGASVASRWMACPGSIRLSREVPEPPETSFALEGTRAHAVAELSLTKGVDPDTFVGMEIEGGVVDDDMADFVRTFVEHCRDINGISWVERRFNLAALNPPGPMFGTADFVAYDAVDRTLYVVDLKYGQGVVVEARGNKQLRYYALGAALSLDPKEYPIERIVMTIVQPRAMHTDGPIRTDEVTYTELIEFADDLMEAARATTLPDAPLNAGAHCRFCPASGVCPAQRSKALTVVQDEFALAETWTPPAPETIPIDRLADMAKDFHILEDWMAAGRARLQAMLERGEEVPGFKLVARRATRKWGDPDTVEQILTSRNFETEETHETKLKSPAQIEKLMGKKPFAAALAETVVKVSSGYNMVPDTDPRPAVSLSPGEEFAALLPASDD
jgi:hypothetical protein